MVENFVTYEVALKLKEKGFNEPCFGTYNTTGTFVRDKFDPPGTLFINTVFEVVSRKNIIAAPLYQQVMDWFREKHNMDINIEYGGEAKMYAVFVKDCWIYENGKDRMLYLYNEARQAAIEQALTLI